MRFSTLGSITDIARQATWSSPDLQAAIAARRGALARLGAAPRRSVLIAHGGSPAFFADLLATWSLGAAAICADPGLTAPELTTLVDFAQPVAVLVSETCAATALPVPIVDLMREPASDAPEGAGALDDPALILFTSGTTGEPKGVVHSFRSILARVALNRQVIGPALARSLCVLPTHFGHGLIGNALTPLLGGDHLLVGAGATLQAAGALGSIIDAHAVTFMSSVPSFWKLALRLSKPPARPLARVHVGSAPLAADQWEAICAWAGTRDVVNCYGITETANWIAGASARDHVPADGLVGRVWGGAAMAVDAAGRPAAEGEIWVQTPALMTGYLHRHDLTAAVLRDGWFATGDTGRVEDGVIHLTGRQKDEINHGGLKVQPAEIDLLVERHPDVVEACCFAIPDPASGEAVAVAVRLKPGAATDTAELRAWCAARIRREAVPERWFVVDEIPKTDRGKIRRSTVRDRCLGGSHS
jgi:acyl-CoA synthetase (AMP-forming)/AMP-acid ligase II